MPDPQDRPTLKGTLAEPELRIDDIQEELDRRGKSPVEIPRIEREFSAALEDVTPFGILVLATRVLLRLRDGRRGREEGGVAASRDRFRGEGGFDSLLGRGIAACRAIDATRDIDAADRLLAEVSALPESGDVGPGEYRGLLIEHLREPLRTFSPSAAARAGAIVAWACGLVVERDRESFAASGRADVERLKAIPPIELEHGPFDPGDGGPLGPWAAEAAPPRPESLTSASGLPHSRRVRERVGPKAAEGDDAGLGALARPHVIDDADPKFARDLAAGLEAATPFASVIFATRALLRARGATAVPAEVDPTTPIELIRRAEQFDRMILLGLRACAGFDAVHRPDEAAALREEFHALPEDPLGDLDEYRALVADYLANPSGSDAAPLSARAGTIAAAVVGLVVSAADDPDFWRDSAAACLRGDVRKLDRLAREQVEHGPFDPGERGPLKRYWPDEAPGWHRPADPPAIERGLRHSRRLREASERCDATTDDQAPRGLMAPPIDPREHPELARFDRLEGEIAELRRTIVGKFQAHLDAVHELRNLGDFDLNKGLAKRVSVFAKEHGISLTYNGKTVYLRCAKGGTGGIGAFQLLPTDDPKHSVYNNEQFPKLAAVSKSEQPP